MQYILLGNTAGFEGILVPATPINTLHPPCIFKGPYEGWFLVMEICLVIALQQPISTVLSEQYCCCTAILRQRLNGLCCIIPTHCWTENKRVKPGQTRGCQDCLWNLQLSGPCCINCIFCALPIWAGMCLAAFITQSLLPLYYPPSPPQHPTNSLALGEIENWKDFHPCCAPWTSDSSKLQRTRELLTKPPAEPCFTHLHYKALIMAPTCLGDELILKTSSFFVELHYWVFATRRENRALSSYLLRHVQHFRSWTSLNGRCISTLGQHKTTPCLPLWKTPEFITFLLKQFVLLNTRALTGSPRTDWQRRALPEFLHNMLQLSSRQQVLCSIGVPAPAFLSLKSGITAHSSQSPASSELSPSLSHDYLCNMECQAVGCPVRFNPKGIQVEADASVSNFWKATATQLRRDCLS